MRAHAPRPQPPIPADFHPTSAGIPTSRDRRAGAKKHSGLPPGGVDHLIAGGLLADPDPAAYASDSPRKVRSVGGAATVVLGSEQIAYECGTKEAQMRIAVDPAMQRATDAAPVAGGRPLAHAPRMGGPVGGPTRIVLDDGSGEGPQLYNNGLDEAQRRAAFDPAALAYRDSLPMAGARVSRAGGLRVTHPNGASDTINLSWMPPDEAGSSAPVRRTGPASPQKDQPVGGRGAAFLPVSTMGGLLRQEQRPGTDDAQGSARRGGASNVSSGMSGIMGGTTSSAAAAAHPAPRSPSNPLKREQPLGGRSLLSLGGLDVPMRPDVVGMRVPAHARSQVTFG